VKAMVEVVAGVVAGAVVGDAVVAGAVVGAAVVGGVTAAAVTTGATGFETVDEQPEDVVHGPVVIVAVFVMVPVAVAATMAAKVTVALSLAARLTVKVQVLPLGLATLQVSGEVTAQAGVPVTVRADGTTSVTVADPAPSPTFLMAMVYLIVEPGATEVPDAGTSVFVTVKFGAVTLKHSAGPDAVV